MPFEVTRLDWADVKDLMAQKKISLTDTQEAPAFCGQPSQVQSDSGICTVNWNHFIIM
jgi:hypothetical protein